MNDILMTFLRWVKDPFGRKEVLSRHTSVLQDIYTTQAITKQVNDQLVTLPPRRSRHYTTNPINRALLGNKEPPKDAI